MHFLSERHVTAGHWTRTATCQKLKPSIPLPLITQPGPKLKAVVFRYIESAVSRCQAEGYICSRTRLYRHAIPKTLSPKSYTLSSIRQTLYPQPESLQRSETGAVVRIFLLSTKVSKCLGYVYCCSWSVYIYIYMYIYIEYTYLRWTPHPVLVAVRADGYHIKVFSYSCYITVTGRRWVHQSIPDRHLTC